MKTAVLITLAALLAATMLAAPTSAATPTERRLMRQVSTLQKQVKKLQAQMAARQQSALLQLAALANVYSACLTAATADAFQGTWEAIDRHALHGPHAPEQWGPQTPVADPLNSCQRLEVQRQANPAAVPTADIFAGLLNLFR